MDKIEIDWEEISHQTHQFAQALASLRELLTPLDEAVAGYMAQLKVAGWSESAAEQMAVNFHGFVLQAAAKAEGQEC